jgi:GntR family transcriptional repressor for pyruvate dehydrogenase complex
MAAARATGDDLAAISEEVTGMFASLEDCQAFLVHDIRFHRAVAAACGNPILASLVEMVSAIFYELRRRTASLARDQRPVAEMHRRIYHAIRDHDRTRAQDLMREHLVTAEEEQESEEPESPMARDLPAAVRPRRQGASSGNDVA